MINEYVFTDPKIMTENVFKEFNKDVITWEDIE